MNCVFFYSWNVHYIFFICISSRHHIHKTCRCSFSLAPFFWDKPERLYNNITLKHSHAFSFFLFLFFLFYVLSFYGSSKVLRTGEKKQPHYVTEAKWMTTFREHFNSVTFLQPAHFKTSAFFFSSHFMKLVRVQKIAVHKIFIITISNFYRLNAVMSWDCTNNQPQGVEAGRCYSTIIHRVWH